MGTDKEKERYKRQILLPEVGTLGQEKLSLSSVLLIGAGGLGSSAAFYLAAAGVGRMGIVDNDRVDKSNLNRQILHSPGTIGTPKAESARDTLQHFNSDINIETHKIRFTSEKQYERLIKGYDIVLDCTDNYDTRFAINQACVNQKKPWVYGAVSEFEGQAMTIVPGITPCYRCLYPSVTSASNIVSAVMGVTPGFIGILQATEALKYLLNMGKLLSGRLLYVDLKDMHFETLKLKRNTNCPSCRQLFRPDN